jgi:hypothetical protein
MMALVPLLIFFWGAWRVFAFVFLRLVWVAGWLWTISQATNKI